jgi:hypothetical protein
MPLFAELDPDRRLRAIEAGAARLGVHSLILEKDFWVCWALGRMFGSPALAKDIVFKGGTTLSKVFGVIHRFSEDIDLSVSPATLGFDESSLDLEASKSRRAKRFGDLQASCASFVAQHFQPLLEKLILAGIGNRPGRRAWLEYQEDARTHSPVLRFEYPSVLPASAGYIEPSVKFEFGSLTDQRPTGTHHVMPLLADVIPGLESEKHAVVALEVERTFWEKATILHAEYHRPQNKAMPDRFARHYSDFVDLWRHPSRDAALGRLDLLDRVAMFKSRFFASGWANYVTATSKSLRLRPPREREAELERDYRKMEPMFFAPPRPFSEILDALSEAEHSIHSR